MKNFFFLALCFLVYPLIAQVDDCDVNLIEVALVDVTGFNGQPNFDNAHICSIGDTIRVEFGTPGITCNPNAVLTLNEFRVLIIDGFVAEEIIISGGIGGSFIEGVDYTFANSGDGRIEIDLNPGAALQIDQNNPITFDIVLTPDCSVADESLAIPMYELDYSLPGNIPSQVTGSGLIDLRGFVFEPFLNIISSSTTPAAALPGEVVCREVIVVNNGQFSLLDTFVFKDLPDFAFSQVVSFDIFPIESSVVSTTAIDGLQFLESSSNVDSIQLLIDGETFGGPNGLFEVNGGVQLVYCVETQCPATVNNSSLSAWYGCNEEVCQESTDLESVVVVFNGIPDLNIERQAIIPREPCVDPLIWEFRIVNDSINGGALETLAGEADAQNIKATIYRNECQVFEWEEYFISIGNIDGTRDDHTAVTAISVLGDSICFAGLPDVGVNDTLIIKVNLGITAIESGSVECEALVNQEVPSCLDPWLRVTYEDRCQDMSEVEQSQPISSSFPPTEGNPLITFSEVEYTEPSYCGPGKIVFEMNNMAGLDSPTTTAQDIAFYIRKEFCSTLELINYEYGDDASTGNTIDVVVDETSLDSFYVVSIPGDIKSGSSVFFSFEIALDCKNNDACVHPDAECFMPHVKATWNNCYDLRWFTEYEFPYKILDYKPSPENSLENFGGGAGPTSFTGSGCSYRNYWYRYQFGGINMDDCRVFLRYKVAQINDDGSAGTVMSAADMAAGVASITGSTTHSIESGVGGAPDTLVIEVESDFIESCIEEEEILINVQHASVCTSAVEPVKFFESYEVIFECDNGTECCTFKRSCYEQSKDCFCGTSAPTPICYLYCLESTSADLCRITNGCPVADDSFVASPDPKNFALPCDTLRLNTSAQFIRQSSSPTSPACDEIVMMFAEIDPGPHLEYCEGTASFTVTDGASTLTSNCTFIPYDPINGEFDMSMCIDWSSVKDGWTIDFEADWKVKEAVPTCADGFMMEEIEVEFKGTFADGANITNCGSPRTQMAEYFVGDPFLADMLASLEFENGCEVSAKIEMLDECGVGNLFNDYRPGYILDSIVYNISGADFIYTPNSAVLTRKGLNGAEAYDIPASQVIIDNANGFSIKFENDGSWPEELSRNSDSDSLFCLVFDLEFAECYAYSTNIVADSKIYYHHCGGCGAKEIESPGGIEFNNPPEAILNCLGAPIVQTPSDDVVWNIQVGHTPTADFHWVAFDLPPSIIFDQVIDNSSGVDIIDDAIVDGSVVWFQLGSEEVNELTLDATFFECDTMYVPVYVGWSCNGYPEDPITGEFSNGESCNIIQKELAVVRSMTGLQASFVNQLGQPVDLCEETTFEVVIKNVGVASHFMQEFCVYLPKDGMEIVPGSICFAHPDTIPALGSPGVFTPINDMFVDVINPDTIVNGQPSRKVSIDMGAVAVSLGTELELLGAAFPEDNLNKYRFKWKTITDCDFISGSKLFAEAFSVDACDTELFSTAESSNLIPIDGLDPRNFNRNQVVLLDTMLGACIDNQIITTNIVSFPSPTGPNEFVCITFPNEVTVNGYVPFNPATWTMTPTVTQVSGGSEYCWEIPEGTPPGVLAFNLDLSVDSAVECGMLNFASLTKVSKDAVCITSGETCNLEIFTSELTQSAIELVPAVEIVNSEIGGSLNCSSEGGLLMDVDVAVQNLGSPISEGTSIELTVFSDDNGNQELDTGESLTVASYTDGLASSQIAFITAVLDLELDQLCTLMAVVGGSDCACSSDAAAINLGRLDLNICDETPLVCEGGQGNLLCEDLPPSGYTLQWSSPSDPDLIYLDEATGVFGPAPTGTQTYDITMNLGDGCTISGSCSIQVIGELGNFTITGEPSCIDELAKCTIELEPLCVKEADVNTLITIPCAGVASSLEVNRVSSIGIIANGNSIVVPGPSTFTELVGFIDSFNLAMVKSVSDVGTEICTVNEFGIEQVVIGLPKLSGDNLIVSEGDCSLITPCLSAAVLVKLPTSGQVTVSFETPCGSVQEEFVHTTFDDLQAQVEAWFNTEVSAIVGGIYTVSAGTSGVFIDTSSGITCDVDDSYLLTVEGNGTSGTRVFEKECQVECSGSYLLGWGYYDINGNEIEVPETFCCSQDDVSFAYRPASVVCKKATATPARIISLTFSEEMEIPNPLNEIILYNWENEGGDVISQENNCAYLRWSEVGTYEVCATPLLSPDSGLDCDIPPVCKMHQVIEDDVRATVSVIPALTCNEVSSVSMNFESPEGLASVVICDDNDEDVYSVTGEMCGGFITTFTPFDGEDFGQPIIGDFVRAEIDFTNVYVYSSGVTNPVAYDADGNIPNYGEIGSDVACQGDFEPSNYNSFDWDVASGVSFADHLVATINNGVFYDVDSGCNASGLGGQVTDCGNGYYSLSIDGLDLSTVLELIFVFYDVDGRKHFGSVVFAPAGIENGLEENITEILQPGEYTAKVMGGYCGTLAEYPFSIPEVPTDEVLSTMICANTSACATADGSIFATGLTNGVIDSLVLFAGSTIFSSIDYTMESPPLFTVEHTFENLPVGAYTIIVYSECGESQQTCDINSDSDVLEISESVVMQYTDCASDDAEISINIESSNTVDSIIWCGPMEMFIKDIGPHTSPYSATTGSGIIFGSWTAKVYTACGNTQEVFSIAAPPPSSAIEIDCQGNAPVSCLESFGSLDISLSYLPTGFEPDSIVLTSTGGLHLVDVSGSLTSSFEPLIPGTYTIDVYSWNACNNQTLECVVPKPMDQTVISSIEVPELPCAKLYPDSLSTVTLNYTTDPNSLDLVRIDWYKGLSVNTGALVHTNISPSGNADSYEVPAGEDGDYCVVVIAGDAGLFSTCPRDTICFEILSTECPPDCALAIDTFDFVQKLDCVAGSVFSFSIAYDASGCIVEEGIANGSGFVSIELIETATGAVKELSSSMLLQDTLSCSDLAPGDYEIIVTYFDDGSEVCMDIQPISLLNTTGLEYTLEVDVVPTPCNDLIGKITVTSIVDNLGNSYQLSDFNYVLLDGFTTIATITSPALPTFCDLMTGLYTVEITELVEGCMVGSVGAIVPNMEAEAICPNSILAANNCGPCDGTIVMPDSLGIIYRMQDAMGNLVFPQDAPNDHIFVDVCAGMYEIIAFDLSLNDPSICPAICDVEVPISDDGFSIALDTISGNPCELNDGRILVTSINGNCNYNYELYSAEGAFLSNTPVPSPSANICSDKSDEVIFLNLEPGTYKVIGWATDNDGNTFSCMDMDSIILRDNDIKIKVTDIVSVNPLCANASDGSFCINGVLGVGEIMEIRDSDGTAIANIESSDPSPYCFTDLPGGNYQIRISSGEGIFACTEIFDIMLNDPEMLECEASSIDPSDCRAEDGSISVVVNGGAQPYSIVWDNPAVEGFAPVSLPVGTYAFEVTDVNACSKRDTIEIDLPFCNEPCPIIIEEFAVVDAQCGEANGDILVTVQGQGLYTYLWDNGDTDPMLFDLPAGIYCVTITSVQDVDCTLEVCQEIDEIDGPVVSALVEEATCDNYGVITLDLSEGTPDYTIVWDGPDDNDGGPEPVTSAFELTGLEGYYNITITDANGCQNLLQVEMLKEEGLQVIGTIDQFPSCMMNTGQISVTTINGAFPFEFYVNDILYSTSNNATSIINDLGPGSYTLSIIDGEGCVGETTVTLVTGGGPTVDPADWIVVPAVCSGDAGHLEYLGGGNPDVLYKVFSENSTIALGQTTGDVAASFEVPVGVFSLLCEDQVTGCTDVLGGIEVLNPEPLDFVVQYAPPISCNELGYIRIVEITGGYEVADLDILITDSAGALVTSDLTTGLIIESGSFFVSICYTGTDTFTSCCKTREVEIISDLECCQSLGGQAFFDYDYNGCQNGTLELGTVDVISYLFECSTLDPDPSNAIAVDTTDILGEYYFGPDEAGASMICLDADKTYFVLFDIPNGVGEVLEGYAVTEGSGMNCIASPDSDDVDSATIVSDCYDPEDDDSEDGMADEHIDLGITPCINIIAEFSVVDAVCFEGNGSMAVLVNADGNYSYEWSNGATTSEIANLTEGTYCVTITSDDGAFCRTELCQEIDNILSPEVDVEVANATCEAPGEIVVTMINNGSIGDRIITWDGPEDNDGGPVVVTEGYTIVGLPGTYYVTISDNAGCKNNLIVEIGLESTLSVSGTVITASDCNESTGEVSITVTDGVPDYVVYVDNIVISNQSADVFLLDGLSAGLHIVKILDAEGCIGETLVVIESVNTVPVDPSEWIVEDALCAGATGSLSYSGSGSPELLYTLIYQQSGLVLANISGSENFQADVAPGTYAISCLDQTTGCISSLIDLEVLSPEPLDFVVQYLGPTCAGGMTDGIIEIVEITGGYDLGELDIEITGVGQTITDVATTGNTLMEGSYIINVCYTGSDESTTCCKTRQVELKDRVCVECPGFMSEVAVLEPSCNRDNGYAYIVVQGDSDLYTYMWSNGAEGQEVHNLSAGEYHVTITASFAPDCPQVKSFTVGEIGAPILTATIVNPTCETPGSITIPIEGNSETYTVTWTGPTGVQSAIASEGDFVIEEVVQGSYMIEVADAIGCMDFIAVELVLESSLSILANEMSMRECGTDSGEITVEVFDGIPDYTFSINGNVVDSLNGNTHVFTGLAAGAYNIEVIDANGCIGDTIITIHNFVDIPESFPITSYMHAECGVDLGLLTVFGDGIAENLYEIYALGSTIPIGQLQGDEVGVFDVIPGVYYLLCTDPDGCQLVPYSFDVKTPPILDFWVQYECSTACGNELANGTISVVDLEGYPIDEVEIIIGGDIADTRIDPETTISGLSPGNYTVTVIYYSQDGAAQCPKTLEVEICQPLCTDVCPEIKAEVAVVDAQCSLSNGNAIVHILDDPQNYTYIWSNGVVGQEATDLAPGYYEVTITSRQDENCGLIKSLTVGEIGGPIIDANLMHPLCLGDGVIDLSWTGGFGAVVIEWNGPINGLTMSSENTFSIEGPSGIYLIEIRDSRGCSDYLSVNLEELPSLNIIVDSVVAADCGNSNGELNLSVNGGAEPYEFVLNGQTLFGTTVSHPDLEPGVYTASVVDANGCTGESNVIVESANPQPVNFDDWTFLNANCSGDEGSIVYTGGGDSEITYELFVVGSTIPFASVIGDDAISVNVPADSYYISCINPDGCSSLSAAVDISSPAVLDYTVQYYSPTCYGASDGIIEIVELTNGYDFTELEVSITNNENEVVGTSQVTEGLVEGEYFITISYEGLQGEACPKSRAVRLIVDYCCQELGGVAFYDYNYDGCQNDSIEVGVEGVLAYLYSCSETNPTPINALAIDTTGLNGDYNFSIGSNGLASICLHQDSTYYVVFDIPNNLGESLEGFDFTSGDSTACATGPESDDVNPETGTSDCYNPDDDDSGDGDSDEDIDVGIYPCQQLGGEVFSDLNNNGCQDADETLVTEDVTINLYACDDAGNIAGGPVATTSTGTDGAYTFGPDGDGDAQICLDPAVTYLVEFVLPNGADESLEDWDFTNNDAEVCGDIADADDVDPNTGQSGCYNPDNDDDDDGDGDEDIDVGIRPTLVDVALIKTTAQTGPFKFGDNITFDIQVFNQGNVDLYEVKVNDFIPCGYRYLSSNNSDWDFDPFTNIAATTVSRIERGGMIAIPLTLEISPCTLSDAWLNIAEVERFENEAGEDITNEDIDSNGDSNPVDDATTDNEYNEDGKSGGDEDDNDPEEVEVFDLALLKTIASVGPYFEGDVVEFNISVINQGNMTAANIQVADHLPIGYDYSEALNPGWDDSEAPTYFYNIAGVLEPGDTITVSHFALVNFVDRNAINYTNIAEISDNTDGDGNPVVDADSDPDEDKDNDGTPSDNQVNDKGDEDDHDPEVLDLTQDFPPDCVYECQLACVSEINLSLDNSDCETILSPANFIAGLDADCASDDFYNLELTDASGNLIDPAVVSSAHIGQSLTFKITNNCENSCWGTINIEYKQGPVIDCPPVVEVTCLSFEFGCEPAFPKVNPGCLVDVVSMELTDQSFEVIDCGATMEIYRQFTATDAFGYTDVCDQTISLLPIDVANIAFPLDVKVSCGDAFFDYDSLGVPLPWLPNVDAGISAGVPLYVLDVLPQQVCEDIQFRANEDSTLFYVPLEGQVTAACQASLTYSDFEVPSVPCKRKIMRTWEIQQWSCGTAIGDIELQVIELIDNQGPMIVCPVDQTIDAIFDCGTEILIPAATATDDCGQVLDFTVTHPSGFSMENGGRSELPLGSSVLTYRVYDACGNSSSCESTITVMDDTRPTAICDEFTIITIQETRSTRIPAEVFDDGSLDACDELAACVTRMDEAEYFDQLSPDTFMVHIKYVEIERLMFGCAQDKPTGVVIDGQEYISRADLCRPSVNFCCPDSGQDIMVAFEVSDPAGNSNLCMVTAEIKEIGLPSVACPEDTTIDCTQEIEAVMESSSMDLLVGNCGQQFPVSSNQLDARNDCGIGTVAIAYEIADLDGSTIGICSQTITVVPDQIFNGNDIVWPTDFQADCATAMGLDPSSLALENAEPILPEGCNNFVASFEDQFFTAESGGVLCGKVVRRWTVVDWCSQDSVVTYQQSQLIEVLDQTAPVIMPLSAVTLPTANGNCSETLVTLFGTASDDCTDQADLVWQYEIQLEDGSTQSGTSSNISQMLPIGIHKVIWTVTNNCGSTTSAVQEVRIISQVAPTMLCANISVTLETAWANATIMTTNVDFGTTHPCHDAYYLSFAADSLVEEMTFDCTSVGQVTVPLYGIALPSMVTDTCLATVTVDDHNGVCTDELVSVTGNIYTETHQMVEAVDVQMSTSLPLEATDVDGYYAFEDMPLGDAYQVSPAKNDDPMNGVSTLDLILMQRHILGIDELDSPYQYIAADIDNSKKINGIDLIELRKLILGINDDFPANTSWRFINETYEFPYDDNPWSSPFPELFTIRSLDTVMQIDFIGVKVGDINGDVEANLLDKTIDTRGSRWPLELKFYEGTASKGELVVIPIYASNYEQISGWQGTFRGEDDKARLIGIESGALDLDPEDYHLDDLTNSLTVSYSGVGLQDIDEATVLFKLVVEPLTKVSFSQILTLNSSITAAEAYRSYDQVVDLRMEAVTTGVQINFIKPNPWRTRTDIEIVILQAGEATLEFYDLSGRQIMAITEYYNAGKHTVRLIREEFPNAGMIYVKLKSRGHTDEKQMILLD